MMRPNSFEIKNALQKNILIISKEFLLRHKWSELISCMKLLNMHLARQYIHVYWKVIELESNWIISNLSEKSVFFFLKVSINIGETKTTQVIRNHATVFRVRNRRNKIISFWAK